jgi:membrane-associated phospholipid phosphatase
MKEIIESLGMMPVIVFSYIIYYLYNKGYNKRETYIKLFILLFVLNLVLNSILKILFKHKRPKEIVSVFNMLFHPNRYGMPSAHTQSVSFSILFLYMLNPSIKVLIIGFLLILLTASQRVLSNRHTINQTIVGAILGSLLGISGKYV